MRAVEPSPHRARFVRDTLGIPCEPASFEAMDPGGPFDLVFASHVLEHVSDPAAMVARCAELPADDGLLAIAVPDLWLEFGPQALLFAPHLSLFAAGSLTRLLERQGFAVLRVVERPDLRVLARRTGSAAEDVGTAEAGFEERLARWFLAGFGGGAGERTVLWTRSASGERLYDGRVLRRASRLQRTRRLADAVERIPHVELRRAARRLPAWTQTRTLRTMTADVHHLGGLPLRLDYRGHDAPVWVK